MSIILALDLPWPSADLSPNARGHWGKRHTATSRARQTGYGLALVAGARKLNAKAAKLHFTFYPPTAARFDDDNLIGRCKAYRDGIADALRADDTNFTIGRVCREAPQKPGKVRIEIEVAAP